jgi:glycerophosphoryl diester phosphodiesterase
MAYAPENTLDSFALALRLGANGLESDVWLTRDGVPVLDHDGVVPSGRRLGIGRAVRIGEVDADDLPAHIPSLAALYAHCGTAFHLSLDVMHPEAGQRVVDVTREVAPDMLPRLWLCAKSWQSLAPLRGQGARLVDSVRLHTMKEGPERRAATLAAEGIDAVNLHHTDWNGGLVALFHRFEVVTFGWDLQHDHLLRSALRMGLDGVYSDYPDRLVDAYQAELGGAPPAVTG